ncbi:MAG TPA: serine hydroxymethyltransferase, partial [Clostridia bacterium]|nr:serine hydroxymethyltransferase [Clostridia bacterium]
GTQGGPLEHIIAAKAVALKEAMSEEFVNYQKQVVKNAKKLAEVLLSRGIKLVSGGTDNHLMLLDLTNYDITGKELEALLDEAHITVNKNAIPFDTRSPFITSGIRVGTPAVTTRGMKEEEMVIIGNCIADIIEKKEAAIAQVSEIVGKLCEKFPLYENDIL